jgi:hypothetical protein
MCSLHIANLYWPPWRRSMAQVRNSWILTVKALFRSQASSCVIFGGHSSNGTVSSLSTSTFPCQYHPTKAPYTYHIIHLVSILPTHTILANSRVSKYKIFSLSLSLHNVINVQQNNNNLLTFRTAVMLDLQSC